MNNFCIVIPNYNHITVIDDVLSQLSSFNLPIIMVDDASNVEAKNVFSKLDAKHAQLSVVTHDDNQGKGGAVQTGLKQAYKLGFSHAIQVDADGQHDLSDIKKLIALSNAQPKALISCCPIYDDSVPKHRYLARYLTHVWVWIETLSFTIVDSMCGFRVYPLEQSTKLIDEVSLGKRMDFDPEILVRLYWRNVPFVFLPSQVIYPENGLSHFQPLHDNVRISWLHTRLFFGMLIRSPVLIWHKLKRRYGR
ncbi:glycosyltransferase family 2 protein [Pseudoalteromonas sp. NZS71]|uniref:glycosyltransferase family 2 protein n=1 Tax=unclassified Pseudoalteromonas TaxID=194690 RepID=UPI0003F765A7|nr:MULTISPECIES: glycosyltransferase family 2 protein [unclassified Pseudoalteromonas]MBH0061132.1 glycosyltransferase family 2 protein [Pseudoalteromonas sp. NZS71]PKH92001.1 glycosyltransferase family 2 protein [Pseudoalteromonas sp. 78C3]